MGNVLLEEVEYKIEETHFGVWRRYGYINGTSFHEFKSHKRLFGLPLVHFTYGRCPETGRRVWARGVIAVGCFARGIVSVGMVSIACLAVGLGAVGIVAIGLAGVGIIFGLGQFSTGLVALGQMATGYVAIGQIALGKYVLAQIGFGEYVWSMSRSDPGAIEFFKALPVIRYFLP